jgi:hypothetical protein
MIKSTSQSVSMLLTLVIASTLSFSAMALDKTPTAGKIAPAPQLSQSYVWYDGNRQQTVWLNPQVVAEFNPSKLGATVAKSADASAKMLPMKRIQGAVRLWQMNNTGGVAVRALVTGNPAGKYSPVFHDSSTSGGAMRALPGNIIVYLDPQWDAATVNNWLGSHKLEIVKKLEIGPNIYVIKTGPGLEALATANALYRSGEVKAAFPDWWQEVAIR